MALSTDASPVTSPAPPPTPNQAEIPQSQAPVPQATVEVSFVLPCLNEAETLADCIHAAQRCIDEHKLSAEIVIADNGSTDGSQDIARRCGARVVPVTAKGYGSALRGGFAAARGKFLIMGDADKSYDFGATWPFIEKLREGYDMVMGSRFKGQILPGAMPWKHYWIGNPVLSRVGQILYRTRISDFHCGLRAFTKEAFQRMNVQTTGMEFASELVMKAALQKMRIAEVPITLYPDGRSRPPHLRSWRDGWRHLSFMMLMCPRWTLINPGLAMMILGLGLSAIVAFGALDLGFVAFDVHTLIAGSLLLMLGYQAFLVGFAARIYALAMDLGPPAPEVRRLFKLFTLERGLIAGSGVLLVGAALIGWLCWHWARTGFGPLDITYTLRPMVIGATLVTLGAQTILMSFFYSMLGIRLAPAENWPHANR